MKRIIDLKSKKVVIVAFCFFVEFYIYKFKSSNA